MTRSQIMIQLPWFISVVCVCAYVSTHMYIHAYMHTYTHTYIHVCYSCPIAGPPTGLNTVKRCWSKHFDIGLLGSSCILLWNTVVLCGSSLVDSPSLTACLSGFYPLDRTIHGLLWCPFLVRPSTNALGIGSWISQGTQVSYIVSYVYSP